MSDPAPEQTDTIVVGIVDAVVSQAPLRWAVQQARAFGKALVAVSVYPSSKLEPWPAIPRASEGDESAARAVLDHAIEQLGEDGQGVELRREAAPGKPVDVLVERSRSADLLVLGGRRARTSVDQRPLSVAGRCIQLAACPVVVVPTPTAERKQRRERARR